MLYSKLIHAFGGGDWMGCGLISYEIMLFIIYVFNCGVTFLTWLFDKWGLVCLVVGIVGICYYSIGVWGPWNLWLLLLLFVHFKLNWCYTSEEKLKIPSSLIVLGVWWFGLRLELECKKNKVLPRGRDHIIYDKKNNNNQNTTES